MKRKDKRGFTLVEMVAVIVILAVLLLIGVPAISYIMQKMRIKSYQNLEGMVEKGAHDFILENESYKPRRGEYKIICISKLERKGFIPRANDYKGKSCDRVTGRDRKSFVVIYRKNLNEERKDDYTINACMYCEGDHYYTSNSLKPLCNLKELKKKQYIDSNLDIEEYCQYGKKEDDGSKGIITDPYKQ